jgi:hypothetical protein
VSGVAASIRAPITCQKRRYWHGRGILAQWPLVQTDSGLRSVVERFIAAAAQPAVLDPGEEPLVLIGRNWDISEWNGRLVLQAWDTHRNLVRRILSLKETRHDRIALVTERFPKLQGEMQIADLAAASGCELRRRSSRVAFRDRFRLMLAREFAEWRAEDVSTDPNLELSLSPSYARAYLRRGSTGIAAIGAPPDVADCAAIVPFGLIWLDYLRRREKAMGVNRLLLFAPHGRECAPALRAALLDATKVSCQLFVYDERDCAGALDFTDAGNVESTLPPCHRPVLPNMSLAEIPDLPADVDRVDQSDGAISLRMRGLEFARWSAGRLTCGIGRKRLCSTATVSAMANEVSRLRCENAEDRQHPLYSQHPEGWLEAQVRANPQIIDPSLRRTPLYGQVPIFSGPQRGVVDLLGIDDAGRLTVIEVKTTADLQLPFQALDYWLRVRKRLEAGDFERLGYFPGITIRREPPRILLVAPSLQFHSTTETMIETLSPEIDFTRIGLAANWRSELRVMFRLRGAERP